MRLRCRITSPLRAALLTVLIVASPFASLVSAQSTIEIPAAWSNAVRGLANKISVAAGTTRNISLDVKNISSLSSSEASAAQQAIADELTQRHFQLISSTPAASPLPTGTVAQVRITFSEGVEGLVWVAEIGSSDGPNQARQVAIVEFAKPDSDIARGPKDSLALSKKLIWEQPDKFLDFAPPAESAASSGALLILEPSRLALYRSSNAQWQLAQSATIARSNAQPRDVSGHIDTEAQKVSLTGLECAGDLQQPQSLKCVAAASPQNVPQLKTPGHDGSEAAQLGGKCGDANIALVTGTGDWTQPDSIQGIELSNSQASPTASSDPLVMDGPVISLWAPATENAARAIVFNLKTNHYEGYVVTATCTH
jgi:hypothetical protein